MDFINGVGFFIEGTPVPQGSKNAFVRGRRAVMVEANKRHYSWREHCTREAKKYAGRLKNPDAPLEATFKFIFEKPKSVKRPKPSVKPDLSKLIRSVEDSLTKAGVWSDDARVIRYGAGTGKEYGSPAGVWVQIREIKE